MCHHFSDCGDVWNRNVSVEQITHRIDEHHLRTGPTDGLQELLWNKSQIEPLLVRVSTHAPETLSKRLSVTMSATRADFCAAAHWIPSRIRPLDFGYLRHSCWLTEYHQFIYCKYLRVAVTCWRVLQHVKGDKVRMRNGPFKSRRGTLLRRDGQKWAVSLDNEQEMIFADASEFTNFSLAARRAWQSMPHRKVGRPAGSRVSDRISVIFRIDRVLWQEFTEAEQSGLIEDRTSVINKCLRNVVEAARRPRSKAS
jgi:hypothetical protein